MKWSLLICVLLPICALAQWNNPHRHSQASKVVHGAFAASPKTLDPAKAYSSNEAQFTTQIYEPVLQYAMVDGPYQLEPLTAAVMPSVQCFNRLDKPVTCDSASAYSVYTVTLQPNIFYQPHPAFARLQPSSFEGLYKLDDFPEMGTRELIAADYVYQIKRLAHPKVNSPIFGLMSQHIMGMQAYTEVLQQAIKKNDAAFLDLHQHPLEGVKVLGRYRYQITVKGYYPQFIYWLAMPFFAPMPVEADRFYTQPGLSQQNISLDWYPVGTGQYYLSKNDPNGEMRLTRNPHFNRPNAADVDEFVFSLEKESIPRWNKFLQGYYDQSGVSSDSFDQVIRLDSDGQPMLTQTMQKKGVRLDTQVEPAIFYLGFNMLDPVVGGYSDKQQKLRQAIAIAIDYEEYISIFMNGRGKVAHSPLAPGVFGYTTQINPMVYQTVDGRVQRRSIDEARRLLAEAGYKKGINPKTGKPLVLHFDIAGSANPDDQVYFNWLRKQFAKLGIALNIRATHYNRFQDIMRRGQAQIYAWGWMADYPDPENFLFLLYGPNSKAQFHGENAGNYDRDEFNRMFESMRTMKNGLERQALIDRMIALVQKDTPMIFGFHPVSYTLSHQWLSRPKPNAMANNTLKYIRLHPELRQQLRSVWNQPIFWPIVVVIMVILLLLLPLLIAYWRRENQPHVRRHHDDVSN